MASKIGVKVLKEKNVLVDFYEGLHHKQAQVTPGVTFIISPNATEFRNDNGMEYGVVNLEIV